MHGKASAALGTRDPVVLEQTERPPQGSHLLLALHLPLLGGHAGAAAGAVQGLETDKGVVNALLECHCARPVLGVRGICRGERCLPLLLGLALRRQRGPRGPLQLQEVLLGLGLGLLSLLDCLLKVGFDHLQHPHNASLGILVSSVGFVKASVRLICGIGGAAGAGHFLYIAGQSFRPERLPRAERHRHRRGRAVLRRWRLHLRAFALGTGVVGSSPHGTHLLKFPACLLRLKHQRQQQRRSVVRCLLVELLEGVDRQRDVAQALLGVLDGSFVLRLLLLANGGAVLQGRVEGLQLLVELLDQCAELRDVRLPNLQLAVDLPQRLRAVVALLLSQPDLRVAPALVVGLGLRLLQQPVYQALQQLPDLAERVLGDLRRQVEEQGAVQLRRLRAQQGSGLRAPVHGLAVAADAPQAASEL
mmetsp:Transcript_83890/g.260562  ORF Transcript_83890/g.260562 Transcript_83890/m.260562 type:complete len:418 (+) Transcript_83890:67-1320(+)